MSNTDPNVDPNVEPTEPVFEDPFDDGETDFEQAQEALNEYNRLLSDSSSSLSGMDRLLAMDGPEVDYIGSLPAEEEGEGMVGGEEGGEESEAEGDVEPDPEADLYTNDSTPTAPDIATGTPEVEAE